MDSCSTETVMKGTVNRTSLGFNYSSKLENKQSAFKNSTGTSNITAVNCSTHKDIVSKVCAEGKRTRYNLAERLQNVPQCKDRLVEDVCQLGVFDSIGGKRCELSGLDSTVPAALCKAQENVLQVLYTAGAFPIKDGMLRRLKDPIFILGQLLTQQQSSCRKQPP